MKNIETSKKVSRANNVDMCANKEHKELDQTKIVIRELFLYYASKFDETKEYLGDYFMRPAVKVNLMNIFTNIAPNELKTITELIVSNKQLALYIQQYIPDVLVHLKKTADCVESMFYDIFCLNNKVFELLILDLILFSIKSRNELSSYFFITYLNKKLRKLNRFNTYSPNNDQDVNFEDVNLFCLFKNEEIASIKKSEDGTYKFVYSHEEVAEQKFYVVLGKESYSVSYQIMDLMGLLVIPVTLISNLSEKLTYKLKSNKILLNFYTISSNLTNVQISSQDNIKRAYLSSVKHLNRSSQQKYKLHLFKAEKKITKDNLVKLTKNQPTSLNCMTDTSIDSSVNRMSATVEKDLNQEILPMVSDFRVALNSYPKCEVECQLICISKPKFIKLIYSLWQSNKMIASLKNGGDVSRLLSVLKGNISIEKLYSDDNPRYVGTLSSEFIKCKTCECAKLKSVQKGLLYGLLDFLILG